MFGGPCVVLNRVISRVSVVMIVVGVLVVVFCSQPWTSK